jgi:ApaG protein
MSRLFQSKQYQTHNLFASQQQTYHKAPLINVSNTSKDIPGLRATLDRLVYFNDPAKLPSDAPHAFIYFITITNLSPATVTLKGRRWIILDADGHRNVIEGNGIVGKQPTIAPGEAFSYNSYHMSHCNCAAEGSFHGIDNDGNLIHVRIPPFTMAIPPNAGSQTEIDLQ